MKHSFLTVAVRQAYSIAAVGLLLTVASTPAFGAKQSFVVPPSKATETFDILVKWNHQVSTASRTDTSDYIKVTNEQDMNVAGAAALQFDVAPAPPVSVIVGKALRNPLAESSMVYTGAGSSPSYDLVSTNNYTVPGCPWAQTPETNLTGASSIMFGVPFGASPAGADYFMTSQGKGGGACRYMRTAAGVITDEQVGHLSVHNTGTLAGKEGIHLNLTGPDKDTIDFNGPVTVLNQGNIHAEDYGIYVNADGGHVRSTAASSNPLGLGSVITVANFGDDNVSAIPSNKARGNDTVSRDGAYTNGAFINNTAAIQLSGTTLPGTAIDAKSSFGLADVVNAGNITVEVLALGGEPANGIKTQTYEGPTRVDSSGNFVIKSQSGSAIGISAKNAAFSSAANPLQTTRPVDNKISIGTSNATRINGRYFTEASVYFSNGSIVTEGGSLAGGNKGIEAVAEPAASGSKLDGHVTVGLSNAFIDVSSAPASGQAQNSQAVDVKGQMIQVTLDSKTVLKGGYDDTASAGLAYEILSSVEGTTKIAIANIINHGLIGAAEDSAIRGDGTIDKTLAKIQNYANGKIIGFITGGNENTFINNMGTWTLRNKKASGAEAEVKSNLSTGGGSKNAIYNSGTITLYSKHVASAGSGKDAIITLGGVGTLELSPNNSSSSDKEQIKTGFHDKGGVIDLVNNFAGDDELGLGGEGSGNKLTITSGGTGTDPVFYTGGGTIKLDVLLNSDREGATSNGYPASYADLIVIGGGVVTTMDDDYKTLPTYVDINVLKASVGADTPGDGILVIQSNKSSANAFKLKNRITIGMKEYELVQGKRDGTSLGNWYLRSKDYTTVPVMGWLGLAGMAAGLTAIARRRSK